MPARYPRTAELERMAALPIWASVPTVRPPAPECPAALARAAAPHTGFEVQKCQQCAILVSAVDELAFPLNKGVMLMTNEELALLLAFLQLVVSIIALLK